jgi:hypothetical protein
LKINFDSFLPWVASTAVAAAILTAFMFNTFQTKADSEKETSEVKSHFEKRLDRIENKLDTIIEKKIVIKLQLSQQQNC